MDNRIAIGDKLELKKTDAELPVKPDEKQQIYVSQVLDESQKGEYLVSMPFHEGKVIPLSVGQEFWATFYSKSGLLRCVVEVTGRYKQEKLFLMELTQKTDLERIQRREYFRFPYNQPMKYRILSNEEMDLLEKGEEYNLNKESAEWKKGSILDLSGGGIRFASSSSEEKDSFVQVCFEIVSKDKKEMVYAFAVLLRSERSSDKYNIFNHHVMFLRMSNSMREKIIRFIFDAQRKNRSKELGLQ